MKLESLRTLLFAGRNLAFEARKDGLVTDFDDALAVLCNHQLHRVTAGGYRCTCGLREREIASG
jgi:hypothetical protein